MEQRQKKMWDLERQNPALLRPGMRVHFEDITHRPVSVDVPKQITSRQDLTLKHPLFKITASGLQVSDSR